ncbi:TPA: ead/Ea22-like family protein [Klebsiella pneumoniae]
MTDITELALSLKAAAEKATPGPWEVQFGEEIYATDGVDNEQVAIATLDARDADYIALANPANVLALVEALEKAQAINAAAEKLVRCKGRYHSEQNYRALAALFGVNTPDLPPLEHENVHYADAAEMEIAALRQRIAELESRTVKLPQRLQPGADGWDDWYVHSDDEGEYLKFDDVLAMLTAAGIKVEAE